MKMKKKKFLCFFFETDIKNNLWFKMLFWKDMVYKSFIILTKATK